MKHRLGEVRCPFFHVNVMGDRDVLQIDLNNVRGEVGRRRRFKLFELVDEVVLDAFQIRLAADRSGRFTVFSEVS